MSTKEITKEYTLKNVARDIMEIIAGIGWFDCSEADDRLLKWAEEILKE